MLEDSINTRTPLSPSTPSIGCTFDDVKPVPLRPDPLDSKVPCAEWRDASCNVAKWAPEARYTALWAGGVVDLAVIGENCAVFFNKSDDALRLVVHTGQLHAQKTHAVAGKAFAVVAGLHPGRVYKAVAGGDEVYFRTRRAVMVHRLCAVGEDFVRMNWVQRGRDTFTEGVDPEDFEVPPDDAIVRPPLGDIVEIALGEARTRPRNPHTAEPDGWDIEPLPQLDVVASATPAVVLGLTPLTEYVIRMRTVTVVSDDIAAAIGGPELRGLWSDWSSFVTRGVYFLKLLKRTGNSVAVGWDRQRLRERLTPQAWWLAMPDDDGCTLLFATITAHWDMNAGLRSRRQAQRRELEQRLLQSPETPDWPEDDGGFAAPKEAERDLSSSLYDNNNDVAHAAYEADMREQRRQMRDARAKLVTQLDELKKMLSSGGHGMFHSETAEMKTSRRYRCFTNLTLFTSYVVQLSQYCNNTRVNSVLQMTVKASGAVGLVADEEMEQLWLKLCWLPQQSAQQQLKEGYVDPEEANKERLGSPPVASSPSDGKSPTQADETSEYEDDVSEPGEAVRPEMVANPAAYVFVEGIGEASAKIAWSAFDGELEDHAAQRVIETTAQEADGEYKKWERVLVSARNKRQAFEELKSKSPNLHYVIKVWRLGPKRARVPSWWADEKHVPGGGAPAPAAAEPEAEEGGEGTTPPEENIRREDSIRRVEAAKREVVSELNTSQYTFVVGGLQAGCHYAVKVACLNSAATDMATMHTEYSEITYFMTSSIPTCDVRCLQVNPAFTQEFYVLPGKVPLAESEATLATDAFLPRHLFRCYTGVSYQIRLKGFRDNLRYVNCTDDDLYTVTKNVLGEEVAEPIGMRVEGFEAGSFTEVSIRVNLPGRRGFEASHAHWSGWSEPVYVASRYVAVNVLDIGRGEITFGWEIEEESRRACLNTDTPITSVFSVTSPTHSQVAWMPQQAVEGDVRGSTGIQTVTGLPVERYQIRIIVTEVCGNNGTAAAICAEWSWAEKFAAVALVNRFDPVLDRIGEREVSLFCIQQDGEATPIDIGSTDPPLLSKLCAHINAFRQKTSTLDADVDQDARDISKFEVSVLNLSRLKSEAVTRMFVPNSMLAGTIGNLEPSTEYSMTIRPQVVSGTRHHWGQWSTTVKFRTLDSLKISVLTIGEDCFELNCCRPYPYPQIRPAMPIGDHIARLKREREREQNRVEPPAYKRVATLAEGMKQQQDDVFAYLDTVYDFHQEYRLDLTDDIETQKTDYPPPQVREGASGTVRRYHELRSGWRYTVNVVVLKSPPAQGAAGGAGGVLPQTPAPVQELNNISVWTTPLLTIRVGDVAETTCDVSYSRARDRIAEVEQTFPAPEQQPLETVQMDEDAITALQLRIVPRYNRKMHTFHEPVVPLLATATTEDLVYERAASWKRVTELNELKHEATVIDNETDFYPPYFERECDLARVPLESGGGKGPPCYVINFLPGSVSRFKIRGLSPETEYGVTMRRIISDIYRGRWSDIADMMTQSRIKARLLSVTETHATVEWGRKGSAFSNEADEAAELNVPFYGPVGEVVQWQVCIVGMLPTKIAQHSALLSLTKPTTSQREHSTTVPPKEHTLTFPYLIPECRYGVRVRSMQASHDDAMASEPQWSEWSNIVEFTTRSPLVLAAREVGCTMCCIECQRKEDHGAPHEPRAPERHELLVIDALDAGWVQFQTSGDSSLLPVRNTWPITTTESVSGRTTYSTARGLTPGKQYVVLAGVDTSTVSTGAAVAKWGVMTVITTQQAPRATLQRVGEQFAIVEFTRPAGAASTFRLAVNGKLAVANFTMDAERPLTVCLGGLVLNTSYVLRISEQLQTVYKKDAAGDRWGNWMDVLTFSTMPQRPSVAVLYECRGEDVSFFWRLETDSDIGSAGDNERHEARSTPPALDADDPPTAAATPPTQAPMGAAAGQAPADAAGVDASPPDASAPEAPAIASSDDVESSTPAAQTGTPATSAPATPADTLLDSTAPESPADAPGTPAHGLLPPEPPTVPATELFGPATAQRRRMSAAAAAPAEQQEVSAFRMFAERHLACVFESAEGAQAAETQEGTYDITLNLAAKLDTVDEASLPVRNAVPLLAEDCTFMVEVAKMTRRGRGDGDDTVVSEFRKVCDVPTPFVRMKLREGGGIEQYCFRIAASRPSALGRLSSRVSPIFGFTQPHAPNPPMNVTVRDVLHTSALVEWDAPIDINLHNQVVYSVWRLRVAPDEEWQEVDRVRTTAYFVTGLHISALYKVKVRCYSTFGRSTSSNTVKFSTQQRVDIAIDPTTSFAVGASGLNDPRALLRPFDYKWVYPNPIVVDSTPPPCHTPFHLYLGSVPQQYTSTEKGRWASSCTLPHFGVGALAAPRTVRYPLAVDLIERAQRVGAPARRGRHSLPARPVSAAPVPVQVPITPVPPPYIRPSSAAAAMRPKSRMSQVSG